MERRVSFQLPRLVLRAACGKMLKVNDIFLLRWASAQNHCEAFLSSLLPLESMIKIWNLTDLIKFCTVFFLLTSWRGY